MRPKDADAAAATSAVELVKGFRLLRLPVSTGSPVTRCLLVKRHQARTPEEKETASRTLFVTHVDNFVTEAQLQSCFAAGFGPVEQVELKSVEKKASKAEQRADFVCTHVNFARIVFKAEESLQKALAAANGRIVGAAVLPLPGSALKEQLKAHRTMYRDSAELREEIDTWMAGHDAREDEKRRLSRESALVDEDGFTKVVSGATKSSDNTFTIKSAARAQIQSGAFHEPIKGARDPFTQGDRRKRKKKEKEMPDFYRFQLREKRREEIGSIRKRAVEDTEKVERMRQTKRLKAKADQIEKTRAAKADKVEKIKPVKGDRRELEKRVQEGQRL